MDKNIGNVETYEGEFVEEQQEQVTAPQKGTSKGFVKRNWKKGAIGLGLFVLGVAIGKAAKSKSPVEYADVVEGEFVVEVETED